MHNSAKSSNIGIRAVPPPFQQICFAIPGESKKVTRLGGNGMISMWPIFKTKLLIFHSNANLDEKILFDKITHHLDPEMRKYWCLETQPSHSILLYDLLVIEIKILFLKLTMTYNFNFHNT